MKRVVIIKNEYVWQDVTNEKFTSSKHNIIGFDSAEITYPMLKQKLLPKFDATPRQFLEFNDNADLKPQLVSYRNFVAYQLQRNQLGLTIMFTLMLLVLFYLIISRFSRFDLIAFKEHFELISLSIFPSFNLKLFFEIFSRILWQAGLFHFMIAYTFLAILHEPLRKCKKINRKLIKQGHISDYDYIFLNIYIQKKFVYCQQEDKKKLRKWNIFFLRILSYKQNPLNLIIRMPKDDFISFLNDAYPTWKLETEDLSVLFWVE